MTNLRFKTLFGFYRLIILSAIFQSCCEESYRITENGSMRAWELYELDNGNFGRKQISEIKGDFILEVYFKEEISMLNNISFVNSCYATKCKDTWLNSIDESNLSISIEKSFMYDGELVPSFTNLLTLENSGIELHALTGGFVEFRFTEYFFTNAELENGNCLFKFKGMTSDNNALETEMTLLIEL